jgi:hypothetical protein
MPTRTFSTIRLQDVHALVLFIFSTKLLTRKACVSHGFIKEGDSDEVALERLMKSMGNAQSISQLCELTIASGVSWHKKLWYSQYLAGCIVITRDIWYPKDENAGRINPDFQKFLSDATSKYAGKSPF